MSIGWDCVSKLWSPKGLLSVPKWHLCIENYRRIISTGKHSWFFHHNYLATLPAESSNIKAGETGKVSDAFGLTKYLYSRQEVIYCVVKSYDIEPMTLHPLRRHECWGFLSHRPQLVLNPRTLGPMANTLTVTSPKTTISFITNTKIFNVFCCCVSWSAYTSRS
jgi:hypothetical protein